MIVITKMMIIQVVTEIITGIIRAIVIMIILEREKETKR